MSHQGDKPSRKRKSEAIGLDEADKALFRTFRMVANSVSQLYAHSQQQQRVAFQQGARNAAEKLYQWITVHQQADSHLTAAQILSCLQDELSKNATLQFMSMEAQDVPLDQVRNQEFSQEHNRISAFTNALSSPNRRSLVPYGIDQDDSPFTDGTRNSNIHNSHLHGEAFRPENSFTSFGGLGHNRLSYMQQLEDASSMDMRVDPSK